MKDLPSKPPDVFDPDKSLKTKPDDSFFNIQSLFYISSESITRVLYKTPISPHQVILFSMIFGITSSFLLIQQDKGALIVGAVLLFYKNVLDKVDGSLARAKGLDSRRGRFYDSISDFIVNLFLFSTMAYRLYIVDRNPFIFVVVYCAMISSMLQCSYFIYYQISFILQTGKKTINRLIENVTDDDKENEDKLTLFLQRVFLIIYGWQDLLFSKLDMYLIKKIKKSSPSNENESVWYMNKPFLTFSSMFSIGTHMVMIAIFSVFDARGVYLLVNLTLWNLLLISSVIYHYQSTKNKLGRMIA